MKNKNEKTSNTCLGISNCKVIVIVVCISIYQAIISTAFFITWAIFISKSPEFGNAILEGIQIERDLRQSVDTTTNNLNLMNQRLESFSQRHPVFMESFEDFVTRVESEFYSGRITNTNGEYFNSLIEFPKLISLGNKTLMKFDENFDSENVENFLSRLFSVFSNMNNVTTLAQEIENRFLKNGKIEIKF